MTGAPVAWKGLWRGREIAQQTDLSEETVKNNDRHNIKAGPGMWLTPIIFVISATLAATGYAGTQNKGAMQDGPVDFALIGDMPYDEKQTAEFARVMDEINAADLAFVIHAGDFWFDGIAWKQATGGLPPCADETIADRMGLTRKSRHPFILVLGDNEWSDCFRSKPRVYDPLERLAKLRQVFYQGDRSLGRHTIRLTRQSDDARYAKFRENVRWTYAGVQFMTLHMVGNNNNLGRSPELDAEYAERNAANLAWMKETFDLATRNGSRAVMIVAQANPHFETTWSAKVQGRYMLKGLGMKPPKQRRASGFDEFLEMLEIETLAFEKPVVYVHGDTHTFRVDKPLFGAASRRLIGNFTRVETFGWPDTHWVRITIDPGDPNVFRFRQEIVEQNLAKH